MKMHLIKMKGYNGMTLPDSDAAISNSEVKWYPFS